MSIQAPTSTSIQTSPCDICRSEQAHLLFSARDRLGIADEAFQIVACEGCGVRRTTPDMGDEELAKYYPDEYWGGIPTGEWIRRSQADKTQFLSDCNLTSGRILDV